MRKFFMMALMGVATAHAAELDTQLDTLKSVELQNVQVVATRATHKTPVAFTNMSKEQLKAVNFGQDIPYLQLNEIKQIHQLQSQIIQIIHPSSDLSHHRLQRIDPASDILRHRIQRIDSVSDISLQRL